MPTKIALLRLVLVRYASYLILVGIVYLIVGGLQGDYSLYPFFTSLMGVVGLRLLFWGRDDREDQDAVARAISDAPRQQGEWTAVCGTVVGMEAGIGSDVLAYRYQVISKERGVSSTPAQPRRYSTVCSEGYYLKPAGIQTKQELVVLSGFPDLTHLGEKQLPMGVLDRAKSRARQSPSFFPAFLLREKLVSYVVDRVDIDIVHQSEPTNGDIICKSWILRADDEVCVFGMWRDGTLVHKSSRPRGLPVYPGSADHVQDRLRADSYAFQVLGAAFLFSALVLVGWSFT